MWIVNAILLFILSFELALAGITVDLLHFFLFLFLYMLVEKQYEKRTNFTVIKQMIFCFLILKVQFPVVCGISSINWGSFM